MKLYLFFLNDNPWFYYFLAVGVSPEEAFNSLKFNPEYENFFHFHRVETFNEFLENDVLNHIQEIETVEGYTVKFERG